MTYAEHNELKRQRARKWYSENREEINKRRRVAYKQKKTIAAEINGTHTRMDVSQCNKYQLLHNITFVFRW